MAWHRMADAQPVQDWVTANLKILFVVFFFFCGPFGLFLESILQVVQQQPQIWKEYVVQVIKSVFPSLVSFFM